MIDLGAPPRKRNPAVKAVVDFSTRNINRVDLGAPPVKSTVDLGESPAAIQAGRQLRINIDAVSPAEKLSPDRGLKYYGKQFGQNLLKAGRAKAQLLSNLQRTGVTVGGLATPIGFPVPIDVDPKKIYDYARGKGTGVPLKLDFERVQKAKEAKKFFGKHTGFEKRMLSQASLRQQLANDRGTGAAILNKTLETIPSVGAFLADLWVGGKALKFMGIGTPGPGQIGWSMPVTHANKFRTLANVLRNPETYKRLARLGGIRFSSTPGDVKERTKSALWAVAYNATPFVAQSFAMGAVAQLLDLSLNSLLSMPTYRAMANQYGGIQNAIKEPNFWANAVPQFTMDVLFSLGTKGFSSDKQKAAMNQYWELSTYKESASRQEFDTHMKNIELAPGRVIDYKGRKMIYWGKDKDKVKLVDYEKTKKEAVDNRTNQLEAEFEKKDLKEVERELGNFDPNVKGKKGRLKLRANVGEKEISQARNSIKEVGGLSLKWDEVPAIVQERLLQAHKANPKATPKDMHSIIQNIFATEKGNIYYITGDADSDRALVWWNGKIQPISRIGHTAGAKLTDSDISRLRTLESETGMTSQRSALLKSTLMKHVKRGRDDSAQTEKAYDIGLSDKQMDSLVKAQVEGNGEEVIRDAEGIIHRKLKGYEPFPAKKKGQAQWDDEVHNKYTAEIMAKDDLVKYDIEQEGNTWKVKSPNFTFKVNSFLGEKVDGKRAYYGAVKTKANGKLVIAYNPKYIDRLYDLYEQGGRYIPRESKGVVRLPEGLSRDDFRRFVIEHERLHHLTGIDDSVVDENMLNVLALREIGRSDLANSLRTGIKVGFNEKPVKVKEGQVEKTFEFPKKPIDVMKEKIIAKGTGSRGLHQKMIHVTGLGVVPKYEETNNIIGRDPETGMPIYENRPVYDQPKGFAAAEGGPKWSEMPPPKLSEPKYEKDVDVVQVKPYTKSDAEREAEILERIKDGEAGIRGEVPELTERPVESEMTYKPHEGDFIDGMREYLKKKQAGILDNDEIYGADKQAGYSVDGHAQTVIRRASNFEAGEKMIKYYKRIAEDPRTKPEDAAATRKFLKDYKDKLKELYRQYPEEDAYLKMKEKALISDARLKKNNVDDSMDNFTSGLFGRRRAEDHSAPSKQASDTSVRLSALPQLFKWMPFDIQDKVRNYFGPENMDRWMKKMDAARHSSAWGIRNSAIWKTSEVHGQLNHNSFAGSEVYDTTVQFVRNFIREEKGDLPDDQLREAIIKWDSIIKPAIQELHINVEDALAGNLKWSMSDIGRGIHKITENKVADGVSMGFRDNYPAYYKFATGQDYVSGFAKRPVGAYFNLLPDRLKKYTVWMKTQQTRAMLRLREAGELTGANMDANIRHGYAHVTHRLDPKQEMANAKNPNALDPSQDFELARKSADIDDFIYRSKKEGIEPITQASITEAKYHKNVLDRLSLNNLSHYLMGLPHPDNPNFPTVVHIGRDYKGGKMDHKKATEMGYVEMKDAPGFAKWRNGDVFMPPYVHRSLVEILRGIYKPSKRGAVMNTMLKIKGANKRWIMYTPVIFAYQSASSTWAHRPGALGAPKAFFKDGIWPIISGRMFTGSAEARKTIWERTDTLSGQFVGYDRSRLELAFKSNLAGMRIQEVMNMLYDAGEKSTHPALRTANEQAIAYTFGTRLGFDRWAFNNYLQKQIFETWSFKVDHIMKRKNSATGQKYTEAEAGRMAAHFLGDITGIVSRNIYGQEKDMLQLLWFARDYTTTLARQVTGAITPAKWHQNLAYGGKWAKLPIVSRLLNPVWHKELKDSEIAGLRQDYVGQIFKVLASKLIITNLLQAGMGQGLSVNNEPGKKLMLRTNIIGPDKKPVYIDFLFWREAPQYLALIPFLGSKLGYSFSRFIQNKFEPLLNALVEDYTNTDRFTKDPITTDIELIGWKRHVKDRINHLLKSTMPEPLRKGKPGNWVTLQSIAPIRINKGGATESATWQEMKTMKNFFKKEKYYADKLKELKRRHPDPDDPIYMDMIESGHLTVEQYRNFFKNVKYPYSTKIMEYMRGKAKRDAVGVPPWGK